MCNFLSAVVMQNGDILCDPEHSDSHEDILEKFNIRDGLNQQDRFCRVEFIPPKDNSLLFDTKNWTLEVDEFTTPDWFDSLRVRDNLASRVQSMFVQDERNLLLGGCWILGSGARVEKVKNARIWRMIGDAQVREMRGSAQVEGMFDSAQVGWMDDSARVEAMRGSAQVEVMYNSAQVGWMYNSAQVGEMCGSAQVGTMYNSAQVGVMCDSAQVGEMCGSAQVREMCGSAQVGEMYDKSRVITNNSNVGILKDFR